MTIAITGATGYIGSALIRAAVRHGVRVHVLARSMDSLASHSVTPFPYDIASDPPQRALEAVDTVLHLAFDNDAAALDSDDDANVAATLRLRSAAERAGASRFVFVSSQSALGELSSAYGRSKARTESHLTKQGDVIVRPGMVYGGACMGLYGRLCDLVRQRHVLPVPRADAPLQLIHVDDLAVGLLAIATSTSLLRSQYNLAATETTSFSTFLTNLARLRFRKTLVVLPVPLGPIPTMLRLIAGAHSSIRALSERIDGLEALGTMEVAPSLASLGLQLRDVESALRAEARSDP